VNKQEASFRKDFFRLKKEVENIIMTQGVDAIAEYTDKIGQEKLELINNKSEELLKALKLLTATAKEEDYNYINFRDMRARYYDTIDKIVNYLKREGDFTKEIMKLLKSLTKEKTDEMNKIRAGTYYLSYHTTSNILDFNMKIMLDNITYFINNTIDEVIQPYQSLIVDKASKTYDVMQQKLQDLIQESNELEIMEGKGKKNNLKKIVEQKNMESLLNELGYKKERQNSTSHEIFTNGVHSVPVPKHGKAISKNLAYGIQKEIRKEFGGI
jgi:predicted RNA binding protein YcfA (HicA-like mRNA interferase family)